MASYTVEAILKARDSGFSKAFQNAEKSVSGLTGMAGKVGSVFKSVLGANLVSSAITSGLGAVKNGIGGIITNLNDSTAAWASFEGNMKNIGLGAEEIEKVSTGLKKYAKDTIYSASDMASTYAQLRATGVEDTETLVKAFGNLAGSAENPAQAMKSLSQQATQMTANSKVQFADFRIMAQQAPAAMAEVAKKMGMTYGELTTAIKDGKVETTAFFDAVKEAGAAGSVFEKMATKPKTVAQAIDTLTDGISNKLLPKFGELNQKGIDFIMGIADKIESLNIDGIIKNKAFSELGQSFWNAVSKISQAWSKMVKTVNWQQLASGASKVLSMIFNLAGTVIPVLLKAFSAVANIIGAITNSGAFLILTGAIQGVVSVVGSMASTFTGLFTGISSGSVDLIAIIGLLAEVAFRSLGTGGILGVLKLIPGALGALIGKIPLVGTAFFKMTGIFTLFKKKSGDAVDGVTNSVKRSKSTISQIFNGLSNVIKSAGTAFKSTFQGLGSMFSGLGKAFEGLGKGLGAALKGLMQGLKGLNPATLLSFGAAVGLAAVGIGAGIAIIAAGLSLLASQGQGIALIIQSVGTAFGTLASMLIGVFAQAIVTVSGVLPTIATAFAMMSPAIIAVGTAVSMIISSFSQLAPVITALGSAISQIISAISSGATQIITAVTPIVEIISNAFVQIVTVVSQSIVQIIQALAPFMPAVSEMVQAVAPVVQSIVESFTTLITNLSPIIDSLTNLVTGLGDSIRNVLDGAKGVIESFGGAVRSILDGIAGVFDSIGNAALNAGRGFNLLAGGIEKITGLNLFDMGASLAAVATGLGAIGATAGGLSQAGTGLIAIVQGLIQIQSAGSGAAGMLASLGSIGSSSMSLLSNSVSRAVSATTSGMNQIVLVIRSSASQMMQAGQQAGKGVSTGVTNGIRGGVGSSTAAMSAMISAIRSSGMSGVSTMRYIGAMIGQGLAQGMYSALGDVTAAANALVAQAERAAQAKAKIHSPSRLFRDEVGLFIGQGVAVGIDKSQKFVDRAMSAMFNGIDNFNAQVNDLMGGNLAYSFDTGRYSSSVEATYRRQDSEEMRVIKEALSTIKELVSRDVVLNVDSHEVARTTGDAMTDYQNDKQQLENLMWGIRNV